MKAVGIIAEYNPFHNGHKFHLEEARRLAGDDAVIVVMSGNFVQRGEPAILNKWDRAKLALAYGADLIIEIPTLFCLGNAKQYADAAINLLESICCVDRFIFGSECGNIASIYSVVNDLRDNEKIISEYIKDYTKEGFSYPKARIEAFKRIFPFNNNYEILENSNDGLAVEYLLSNSKMTANAIKRSHHNSASEIRELFNLNHNVADMVPDETYDSLNSNIVTNIEDWFSTLRYAVMRMSCDEIDDCPSGGEGLGNRLKSMIDRAESFEQFIHSVKSKRYTYTRISRLCMQLILGITRSKYPFEKPCYIRILASNKKGREVLSYLKDNDLNKIPIISNISKQKDQLDDDGLIMLELDAHASDVYNLVTKRDLISESDYRIPPIIIE